MKQLAVLVVLLIALNSTGHVREAVASKPGPQWKTWTPEVFEQARREGRLVLVDLVAEWCAFCKKMDAVTYRDPRVLATIGQSYIPVRADPERHPQLPQRFIDYGRPSTIILAADGTEIIKKQGYLKPQWMQWMLQAVALENGIGE